MLVSRKSGLAITRTRHSIGGIGADVAAVNPQVHRDVEHAGASG